jgi:hypothetical protein
MEIINASKDRSSTNNMTSNCRFLSIGIHLCGFCLHSFNMAFMYIINSIGDSPWPCLTPLLIAFHSDFLSYILTIIQFISYKLQMFCIIC